MYASVQPLNIVLERPAKVTGQVKNTDTEKKGEELYLQMM